MSDIYNKNAREAHLMAEAYNNIYTEAHESRAERADVDRYEYEQGKEAGEGQSLAKYVAEIAQDIITDNPDETVPPEAAFDFAVEMLQAFLGELTFNDVKDRIHSSEDAESRAERADVDRYEYEQGKKAAYDSEAHAYRDRADKYKSKDARDSIKVGNLYKGESYHELVIGIKGDEVYTDKGNRYDINQMLDELEFVDTIDFDFLNEIL